MSQPHLWLNPCQTLAIDRRTFWQHVMSTDGATAREYVDADPSYAFTVLLVRQLLLGQDVEGAIANAPKRLVAALTPSAPSDSSPAPCPSIGDSITEIPPVAGSLAERLLASPSRIVIATSGTTGRPKQVAHTVKSLTRGLKFGPKHKDDIWALAYPLDHFAGLQVLMQGLMNDNTIVNIWRTEPHPIGLALQDHAVTHLSATPTFYRTRLPTAGTFPSVQRVVTGGEPWDATLVERLQKLFPNAQLRNVYASTEIGSLLTSQEDSFEVPESIASLIRVVDGELQVHRSLIGNAGVFGSGEDLNKQPDLNAGASSYQQQDVNSGGDLNAGASSYKQQDSNIRPSSDKQPDLNAGASSYKKQDVKAGEDLNAGGVSYGSWSRQGFSDGSSPSGDFNSHPESLDRSAWFWGTGDQVEVISHKPLAFRFAGRRSDWINVGGHKVNPQRVEQILRGFAEVSDAVVRGVPNSVTGQLVSCDLVLRPGAALDERSIRSRLGEHLAPYEVPRLIRFVSRIEMTASGKVVRDG